MYLLAILVTLCGLSVAVVNAQTGAALAVFPWLTIGSVVALRRGSGQRGALDRIAPPPEFEALALRLRALLDRQAVMVLRTWDACRADQAAFLDQLMTLCQHALSRDDVFAFAGQRTTLSVEFHRWLGADLLAHAQAEVLPRARSLRPPALASDPRLIAHARRHGWLAPTTLALVTSGSPAAVPAPEPARRSVRTCCTPRSRDGGTFPFAHLRL